MNNWMSRIAIFAVLGAILSSAVLVGCGGSPDDSSGGNSAAAPSNSATSNSGSG